MLGRCSRHFPEECPHAVLVSFVRKGGIDRFFYGPAFLHFFLRQSSIRSGLTRLLPRPLLSLRSRPGDAHDGLNKPAFLAGDEFQPDRLDSLGRWSPKGSAIVMHAFAEFVQFRPRRILTLGIDRLQADLDRVTHGISGTVAAISKENKGRLPTQPDGAIKV